MTATMTSMDPFVPVRLSGSGCMDSVKAMGSGTGTATSTAASTVFSAMDATATISNSVASVASAASAASATSATTQDRLDSLRKQLKSWERDFAAANAGRKAGREDIKADCVFGMYGVDDC